MKRLAAGYSSSSASQHKHAVAAGLVGCFSAASGSISRCVSRKRSPSTGGTVPWKRPSTQWFKTASTTTTARGRHLQQDGRQTLSAATYIAIAVGPPVASGRPPLFRRQAGPSVVPHPGTTRPCARTPAAALHAPERAATCLMNPRAVWPAGGRLTRRAPMLWDSGLAARLAARDVPSSLQRCVKRREAA
ncbi:hypothetical protein P154DRAFT_616992 [Amniculicola lignicola CBS 123094]|uniref:Uncharacterized protein n=1 Tax=Amniculicola lignicola CBS 123094 TaxID=1392246 RepID=A0A6A5WU31_9PLEO|nr:hypothetical protein P154DRAFT_616992 [Amniculicola lignicola CBS 123094]